MSAGRLRDRITFQTQQEVTDGGGGSALTWVDAMTVWGGFRPESGRERLEAGRLEAAIAGVLRVRSSSETRAITEDYRAVIDSVPYQIRSITNPDRRNRYIEMVIERGVAS